MNISKTTIYNALKDIDGVNVYQMRPASDLELPVVLFRLTDLSVDTNLDSELVNQSEEYTIDIFATKTSEASQILSDVEETMRGLGYILTTCTDLDDPDGIAHTQAIFNLF